MALETQIVSLPLGAKLDEGTDPKLVNAQSAVAVCKNTIFRKDGRVEKAPGYLAETCECVSASRFMTSYLTRLHSIESNGADLIVGGCGFDSSFNSYGEEYYNASKRGAATGVPACTTYNRIGKWFPIQQSKTLVAGNRAGATDPDSAYVSSGGVGSVWTAWIEAGAVKLATNRSSDGVALTTPSMWTLTGMTTAMERVRILAVGSYVHVYASSKTELRLAVFGAANYAIGGTAASALVHLMGGKSYRQCSGTHNDATYEAHTAGWHGDFIHVTLVNDSPPAGGVTISVTEVGNGYDVLIHFETAVSLRTDVNTAIAALAGANDVIDVLDAGVLAGAMTAADNENFDLYRSRYSWDAIKVVAGAPPADVAIVAYCEDTARQLELASFTAAGAAGAYGPTAFAVYPGNALAICRCHLGTGAAAYGIAVVYEAKEGANTGDVCLCTHSIDAAFTAVLAETPFFACAADFTSLSNVTICQELITEYQEGAPCAGLAVWGEFIDDATAYFAAWKHVVRAWVLNAATGAVKRECLPRAYNHRLMSRAIEYDRRSHVWLCHESETWPVASLFSHGDLVSTYRIEDTEATWLRATARWPDRAGVVNYGAGLGSITTDGVAAPNAIYWWPAVCADTQDALDVRINRFDYLATGLRSAKMGNGRVVGGGQLMGIEPGRVRAHGFAYPPEIDAITTAYSAGTYLDALRAGCRYKYLAIYEYLDENGELHQSAPSVPAEITTAAAAYADGQTLTITTATDEIVLMLEEGWWDGATNLWVSNATTTATIVIPAKTYATWDELCDAIQMAGNSAIITATGQVSGHFYCWKEDNPCVDTPAAEWVADLGTDRIKMYYYNPGAQYDPVAAAGTAWFLQGVSCSTSSATAAIGFGVVDLISGREKKPDFMLIPQCIFASAVQGVYSVDIPASTDSASVTLSIRPLIPGESARNADDVKIAVYRTEADGTTYHRVYLRDGYSGYSASVLDHMSDAEALEQPLAYTTGEPGDILEHTTPISLVLCSHRDRVWCVDEEDPRFAYVSVPKAQGFAVEFTEYIKVPFPAPVLALRSAGEVMLGITDEGCYAIHGQGPDATGQGEFSAPRLLAPAGVDSHRGVGSLGDLVIWHSAARGLWSLDRGYQAQEIGRNCLDLLAGGHTVKSMVEYAGERRLEINLSSGEALWLDQRFDRWTQQTNFSGVTAACLHLGFPWHTAGAQVCYQGGTTWTRGGVAHAMTVKTAWIHVGALSGLQRVRMESILGDWRDSHTLSIKRYLDYSATAETTRTLAITADPGPYLVKHHPLTQRCSAVQLEISDVPTAGVGGAGFRLTALELEVGVKRGYMHRGKDR